MLLAGWALCRMAAPLWSLFLLSALAMATTGLGTALFVKLTRWWPRARQARAGLRWRSGLA